jgi:PAS domain S-box-containing protein
MINSSDILHGKILIVDDQEVNIQLLDRMLRKAGYDSITSTTDPGEVCALHLENRYDLILLDLQMPGMDGFQVIDALKEIEDGYLPVLVITAQPSHKLRALEFGAKDFISKPFDLNEVLLRVHNMLEVRLLHKNLNKFNDTLEKKVEVQNDNLEESEARFRRLVEHLPIVVYISLVDDASSMIYVSPQIKTLLGYTPAEWLTNRKLWAITLQPEYRMRLMTRASAADQGNESFDMEYQMTARDGHLVWVHDQVILVNDPDGKPQFWQGIMLDITERKHSEERIKRQLEHLTALSAIDRFTASNFDLELSLSEILTHVTMELGVDDRDRYVWVRVMPAALPWSVNSSKSQI